MAHILICDDEKDIVSALKIYVEAEGHTAHLAYNGQEALDILGKQDIQLVLMDVMMPVMDGITVMADGRHLGRAFDNLLLNVCKYAMAGTRVYLDLLYREGQARIILRNISRSPLHISGEELLERFVRGDSSRNTEGSGLGLSIARSLVELHGGSLQLTVDGDLFRVDISLPAATADA